MRKRELKDPRLAKPTRKQISVTERFAVRRSVFARSIRRLVRYARRFAIGRRECAGEMESGVARFTGQRVEVERLSVVAVDEVTSPAQCGQEEQRVLGHPGARLAAHRFHGCDNGAPLHWGK